MRVLVTGATGNLGSFLARHLIGSHHELNLMMHRRELPFAAHEASGVRVLRADLADIETLARPLAGFQLPSRRV